jgi:hypothetical protein
MQYYRPKHQYTMKHFFTLLILCLSLQLSAQTYGGIEKQTVKFDSNRKIKEVCNYHSFPSSVYNTYWYQYNTDGRLLSVSKLSYQGFGKPWYKKPDTTDADFKFTYKYDSEGRKIEEAYYNNYRQLEIKCTYVYKGDSALTVTKEYGWGVEIDSRTVYKLHKIYKTKVQGTEDSRGLELVEKTYFDKEGKTTSKIKYTYGKAMSQSQALIPHYGDYTAIYLNNVKAFDNKGKLLQERKIIEVDLGEGETEYKDTTTVFKETEDGYDIKYEDVHWTRNGNNQFAFNEDDFPRALDYINCNFKAENRLVDTGMWWDQTQYYEDGFDDMMMVTDADLVPDFVEVKD